MMMMMRRRMMMRMMRMTAMVMMKGGSLFGPDKGSSHAAQENPVKAEPDVDGREL